MSASADRGMASSEKDDVHWSWFSKVRSSTERGESASSFRWSLSSALDFFRGKLSSRGDSQTMDQGLSQVVKKPRFEEDRESRREAQREERSRKQREERRGESKKPKKSEKEKTRRDNVNSLFLQLADMVGMQPGKSKSEILEHTAGFIHKHEQEQMQVNTSLLATDEDIANLRFSDNQRS